MPLRTVGVAAIDATYMMEGSVPPDVRPKCQCTYGLQACRRCTTQAVSYLIIDF